MGLILSTKALGILRSAMSVMLTPEPDNERKWHTAIMEAVMPVSAAYKAAIRVPDGTGFQMTSFGFEQAAIQEHQEYYHKFDFGQALGGEQVKASVFSRNAYYARGLKELMNTEYYCDYLLKYRVLDALCVSSRESHHEKGVVLYLWHDREMSDSKRASTLSLLQLMAPAFQSGMNALATSRNLKNQLGAALDASPSGCAVFTRSGDLLHRNPALTAILSQPGSAGLEAGIINVVSGIRSLLFSRSIHLADIHPTSMKCRAGAVTYTVSGGALEVSAGDRSPAILVTVQRSSEPEPRDHAWLRDRHGLTSREIEVAVLLTKRRTNQEVAQHIGVSIHTARHHTENIMRKLGVNDRREIASCINLDGDPTPHV